MSNFVEDYFRPNENGGFTIASEWGQEEPNKVWWSFDPKGSVRFYPDKDSIPAPFYRWMQSLVLGIKWGKDE